MFHRHTSLRRGRLSRKPVCTDSTVQRILAISSASSPHRQVKDPLLAQHVVTESEEEACTPDSSCGSACA